ncbi:structural maintenance of chromosomes protein 6-like isoform X2 [Periplaneta americana]|uniref:structural maintenance of chromosomes protein 6-like isoform X2 n=1 Tax=Periplaneta americana TaxID=6978 RepID=UPI0037E82352
MMSLNSRGKRKSEEKTHEDSSSSKKSRKSDNESEKKTHGDSSSSKKARKSDNESEKKTHEDSSSSKKSRKSDNESEKKTHEDSSSSKKFRKSDNESEKKTHEDSSSSKKSRKSDNESHASNELRNGGECSSSDNHNDLLEGQRAGIIEKIYMRNFMCHSCMEVPLNPRINFVIGRNGSGKSALLTALVVGLGGKASSTSRGSSLKEFIKKGCPSATVEITLRNNGYLTYKPEKYGDRIIVTRVLRSGTGPSGYNIKTEKGVTVSTKREELDRIVTAFNIQVENPISVLNQDIARTFLNCSDPSEKFKLFLKATQLDVITQNFTESMHKRHVGSSIIKSKKESFKQAKAEVEELERKFKRLEAMRNHKAKARELESELYWAVAISEESTASKLEKDLEKEKSKYPELRQMFDKEAEEEKNLQLRLQTFLGQVNDIAARHQACEAEYMESKEEGKRRKDQYTSKLKDYKSSQIKTTRLESNISHLKSEIEKICKISGPDYAAQRMKIEKDITDLQEKHSDVLDTIKAKKQYYTQLNADLQKIESQKAQLLQELLEKKSNMEQKQREIKEMKKDSSNNLSVFGAWAPKVNQKIEEAMRSGKFKKKPRGPLGAYIKLKDASWAPALESYLINPLKYYCVDNSMDNRVLNKIFEEVIGAREKKPTVITSKFLDKVHDVRGYAVQTDKYCSILNMLIISDPVVTNCMIDQVSVENVILIPSNSEACKIMSDKRSVPKNCSRAVTKKSDIFYPDPNYRSYAGEGNTRAKYLQVSMQEAIKTAEEELQQCSIQNIEVEKQLATIEKAYRNNCKELQGVRDTLNMLHADKLKIQSRLTELKDTEMPDSNCLTALTDELNEFRNKLDQVKSEENGLQRECDELKKRVEEAERKSATLRENVKSIQEEERPLLEQIEKIKSQLRAILSKKKSREEQCDEAGRSIALLEKKLREQQKIADKAVADATKICPRIDTNRSPKTIQKELNDCKTYMASVESQTGSIENVCQEYLEKKNKYNEIEEYITKVEKSLEQMNEMLMTRKTVYYAVRRLVALRVEHMFQSLMHERRFEDKANRRVVMDLLLAHARQKTAFQFLFLTPQDTSTIQSDEDVAIYRMQDPERIGNTEPEN